MSIINDLSIIREKNGIKAVLNPIPNCGFRRAGEIFYINKADRTVTCVLYGCGGDAERFVERYSDDFVTGYYGNLGINYSYVGIAKCADEDEFDEEFGMRLARYRANRKREGDIKVVVRNFTKKLRACADLIDRKTENHPNPPVNNK